MKPDAPLPEHLKINATGSSVPIEATNPPRQLCLPGMEGVGRGNSWASHHRKDEMARRRYQRGCIRLRGNGKDKKWVGMWREDVINPDGSVQRVRKSEILGTVKEYKTKHLAQRAFEQRLSEVNSLTYKPRPTATFSEFAERWQRDVLSQHKRSTQAADRSRLRKHLIPDLGKLCMKDIDRQTVQGMVARKGKSLSPKSVRNLIALLSEMWEAAKADGYTQIDPFCA